MHTSIVMLLPFNLGFTMWATGIEIMIFDDGFCSIKIQLSPSGTTRLRESILGR